MSHRPANWPNFGVLLGLAWLLVLGQLVAELWAATAYTLPDPDDAMRLVEVRAFLSGHGWFDLHEARLAPPTGYDSHWSRLIDAGLAGLFIAFRTFASPALAERLMSAIWPVLWLFPTIGAAAAIAWRIAGRESACAVLLLAVFGMPGMGQFLPGRIDHHNAQIALALLAVAATVWSDRRRWAACSAGAVTGLALAVGLEGLPVLALCGAAFGLRYVVDLGAADRLRGYALSLTVSTLAAFFVTVAPGRWTSSVCDEIAINSTTAVIVAGLGFTLASLALEARPSWERACALLAVAALATGAGLLFEPSCIGGPFAMVDPVVRTRWLMQISEMQSYTSMLQNMPLSAVAEVAFPALALTAALSLAKELRRDFGYLVATVAFLLVLAIMLDMAKFYAYCMWLGVPMVAVAGLRVLKGLNFRSLTARGVAMMLVTPTSVTFSAVKIASAAGTSDRFAVDTPDRRACVRQENYALLARLPVGLIVADQLEWVPICWHGRHTRSLPLPITVCLSAFWRRIRRSPCHRSKPAAF